MCNKDGNKPTFIQIFIKNSFDVYVYPLNILLILFIDINFFSGYIFIINALLMIFTPKSITIGDIIAKTYVVHDKKYYTKKWSNSFNWINTDNFKKVFVLIIVVSVVVKLTPPKIYVEDVPDVNDRETYVFTRNKPMSDQEAFDLVVEYDLNNHSELEERYYFPSQYTVHGRGVVMSREEKIESNYYTRLDECDRPNPVTLEYSDSYKMNIYYWCPKDERYQTYYPLKR